MPKQTTSAGKMAARHAYTERLRAEEKAESLLRTTKFMRSRMGRMGLASALLVAGGVAVSHEEPRPQAEVVAEATVPHHIYRTGGEGVWLHDGPGLEAPNQVVMPDGAQFNVDCFAIDDSVNGNPVWLQGEYNGQVGAVTDYYIDTHWDTTQDLVGQGIEECGVEPGAGSTEDMPGLQADDAGTQDLQNSGSIPEGTYASVPAGCYFNFKWPKKNLTFSYEGEHRYYGNAWQAAKNWSDLGIVNIEPAPEGEQGDIVIEDVSVQHDDDGPWLGKVILSEHIEENPKLIQQKPELRSETMYLKANEYYLNDASDYQRTYTFTHEFGHILGIAHTDDKRCNLSSNAIEKEDSIMMSGQRTQMNQLEFNVPQEHDATMLRYLYGS